MIFAFISVCLVAALWKILVPAGFYRRITPGERRVFRWFVGARCVLPFVAQYIAERTGQFFGDGGGSDAETYVELGRTIAKQLETQGYSTLHREIPGTGSIDLALGYVFGVAGGTTIVTLFLVSGISSIGMVLFWLGTRDNVRFAQTQYAAVLLLAPTILYWSSNIGKEPPILLGLGAGAMAVQIFLGRIRSGPLQPWILLATSALCLGYVRPHVALAFFGSLIPATILGRERGSGATTRRRLTIGLMATIGLMVAIPLTSDLLGVQRDENVLDAAYDRAEQTAAGQGRSSYSADPVRSVTDVPNALIIVLLRPYLWETTTSFQLLASIEALAIIGLLVAGLRQLGRAGPRLLRSPHLLHSAMFVLLFCASIVSYGNFGLIARQRMQIWPFVIFIAFIGRSAGRQPSLSSRPAGDGGLRADRAARAARPPGIPRSSARG